MSSRTQRVSRPGRWAVPGFFVGLGAVCMVAGAVGGQVTTGAVVLAALVVCAIAVVLLHSRSETYRDLTGEPDERSASINRSAWAAVGVVLTIAGLGTFVGELAAGEADATFPWLLIVAAVTYVAAVAAQQQRR